MDKEKIESYRQKLLDERDRLTVELKELSEGNLDMLQSEMSGESALDEHTGDSGTATFERERDLTLGNNIQDLINRIDRALGKIEAGTYGICDRCGRDIDPARIKAVPYANLCITCKTLEENEG
jgi:RNA polymerase-binding protein DksA